MFAVEDTISHLPTPATMPAVPTNVMGSHLSGSEAKMDSVLEVAFGHSVSLQLHKSHEQGFPY